MAGPWPFLRSATKWLARFPLLAIGVAVPLLAADSTERELEQRFTSTVRPFLENYCLACHGAEDPKADFDLSPYSTMETVVRDHGHWELVLEKLQAAEMPPAKAKRHPAEEVRESIVAWIQAARRFEGEKNAGDPGPVPVRRLSNAEYDYTIRDLTGVDIRPTKEFPVDPANQAGFDNSGESLAMSPALLKKYLQAARTVAEHAVLTPAGFEFATHPVVADTDRDKYCVLRIVDFYKRQPTDYADYFMAAWRYQHRAALGRPNASLADIASQERVSPKYLALIWETLTDSQETVGPIANLQALWHQLPEGGAAQAASARQACERMRDYVARVRGKIVPEVKNLTAPAIQNGSQTMVMWKNRQMAANRRRYDPTALQVSEGPIQEQPEILIETPAASKAEKIVEPAQAVPQPKPQQPRPAPQPTTPNYINKGGLSLPPTILTTESSATFQMAALKNRGGDPDPDLFVPADPGARARYEAAFARFAGIFPDAFYISERARVYLDAEKEQENAGRLLSAGLHSMTGYFRDDAPLYDLILDEAGQSELDRLWQEFDFFASVPQRMHASFLWFERTDSSYLRDPEFDPFRPEDKSATQPAKVHALAKIYLEKAVNHQASETARQAIVEHFDIVARNIARVEEERLAAEPVHLNALLRFAERAFRRPLSAEEENGLEAFYRESREQNGLEHEEAVRDTIVRVLMSPHFCYRADLLDDLPGASPRSLTPAHAGSIPVRPLSDHALASRLSYFLWSSMPDAELRARAAAGDLNRPEVLAAQARRMMQNERIGNFATEFGGHWLEFRRFEEHNAVDRERYPVFDSELRQAMFEEPVRFFIDLIQNERSVLSFLYADYTLVNRALARFYGMNEEEILDNFGNPSGSESQGLRTAAPADEEETWLRVENAGRFGRGGLLPMAVFLTANSPGLRTSPVKRGYWVVRRLLGERIPPPPAVVPELPSDEKNLGELTLAEALAKHREDPSCASCHARFDSFGLVFEGYGPVGERREKDFGGRPVQTHALFPGGREGSGLAGLIEYIRAHREQDFVENLCRKLAAYGLGRTLLPSDDALIETMRMKLAAGGYRFSALVEALVTSPQFRNKRAVTSAPL